MLPIRFPGSRFLSAALLFFGAIGERSIRIGFPALTGMYESLLFFAGSLAAFLAWYRFTENGRKLPALLFGGTLIAVVLTALASSPIVSSSVQPPVPALRSLWLLLHVSFAFIGEALFAVAFVASLLYLFGSGDAPRKKTLDRIIYTSVGIGYLFFTSGALIFGAIWAQAAWGRYWSWDPKETWALVTWLVYTAYLHARLIRRRTGKLPAMLSAAGFLITLFTLFGVSWLLPGLHSYG